jgi:uncharacterized protein YcgI (DUF1989 family)
VNRAEDAEILKSHQDQNASDNQLLARAVLRISGKYGFPLPYVIARKTRGPLRHQGREDLFRLARAMFSVVEDSCSRHSGWLPQLRAQGTLRRDHDESCRTNFRTVAPLGPSDIVSNINFFMRVAFGENGVLAIVDGISKPGDYVILKAEMPVIAVLSNCPQQNNPAAGFLPTPIEVIVSA